MRFNDWVKARWLAKDPGPNKVGDRVRFRFGVTDIEGTIIEDRGNLGPGRKRVYGIAFYFGDSEEKYVELHTDQYQTVAPAAEPDANGESK
jgi:hypothetical protein